VDLALHLLDLLLDRARLLDEVDVALDRLLAQLVELACEVAQRLLKVQRVGGGFHQGSDCPRLSEARRPCQRAQALPPRNPPASGGGGEPSSSFHPCMRAMAP